MEKQKQNRAQYSKNYFKVEYWKEIPIEKNENKRTNEQIIQIIKININDNYP